jgi:phosphatidylglycerophosphate synthase
MTKELDKQDNGALVPFERWMGTTGAALVPQGVSPNQITLLGGAFGVLAGVAFYLASFHKLWFAVGAVLVFLHWAADNVDGHVARSRNQTSEAGRFLDIFLDGVTFAALGIGLACASYAQFPIVAVATIFCLLQYILTVLWIALTDIWPFPPFGPAEASLTLIVMAVLMLFLPAELFTLWGRSFSLIDAAFALTIPNSAVGLFISARQLYRHLQDRQRGAAAA